MNPADLVGLAGVPLIVALVQLLKVTFPELPSRFLPACAMVLGIALNEALAAVLRADPAVAAITGMVAGLAASGLYAWGKARELA